MGLFEHFPYTNFQNLNIAWVLKEIERLNEYVKQLEADLNNKIVKLDTKIDKEIADRIAGDLALENEIDKIKTDISNIKIKHAVDIINLVKMIGDNLEVANAYTDQEIAKVKELIQKPVATQVYNYFQTGVTPLQTALLDYYNWLRPASYSWRWLDRKGITWAGYDALGKTPLEWDLYGKRIIKDYLKSDHRWMFDPQTGNKVPVKQVVYQLSNYHLAGRTWQEMDILDCDWTGLETLTPYQIDWTKDPVPTPGESED